MVRIEPVGLGLDETEEKRSYLMRAAMLPRCHWNRAIALRRAGVAGAPPSRCDECQKGSLRTGMMFCSGSPLRSPVP